MSKDDGDELTTPEALARWREAERAAAVAHRSRRAAEAAASAAADAARAAVATAEAAKAALEAATLAEASALRTAEAAQLAVSARSDELALAIANEESSDADEATARDAYHDAVDRFRDDLPREEPYPTGPAEVGRASSPRPPDDEGRPSL